MGELCTWGITLGVWGLAWDVHHVWSEWMMTHGTRLWVDGPLAKIQCRAAEPACSARLPLRAAPRRSCVSWPRSQHVGHREHRRQMKPVIATSWVSIATSIRTESRVSSSCSHGGGGGTELVGLFQVVTFVCTL